MSQVLRHRARVAALTRSRAHDDPELITERQSLKAARLAEHIKREVATWPALTDADRAELARLLLRGSVA